MNDNVYVRRFQELEFKKYRKFLIPAVAVALIANANLNKITNHKSQTIAFTSKSEAWSAWTNERKQLKKKTEDCIYSFKRKCIFSSVEVNRNARYLVLLSTPRKVYKLIDGGSGMKQCKEDGEIFASSNQNKFWECTIRWNKRPSQGQLYEVLQERQAILWVWSQGDTKAKYFKY